MRPLLRIIVLTALTGTAALPADAAFARTRTTVFAGTTEAKGAVTAIASDRRLTVRPLVDLGCDDGSFTSDAPRFKHMRILANGRFRGAVSDIGATGSRAVITVGQVRGRLHGRRARGTVRETIEYLDDSGKDVVSCRSGRVRFSVRRGRTIFGGHSRLGPVTVKLGRDATTVKHVFLYLYARCADGSALSNSEDLTDFPVGSDGSFGDEWTSETSIAGTPASFAYAVHGRVAGHRVKGVVRVQITLNGSDPSTQTTCDTGRVWFTARR